MDDKGLRIADVGEVGKNLEPFDELATCLPSSFHSEGQDRPAPVGHQLLCSIVIGMVGELRIGDPLHLAPSVQELDHFPGVLDMLLHPDRQSFRTLQDVERVLGREGGAEVTQTFHPGPDDEGLGTELLGEPETVVTRVGLGESREAPGGFPVERPAVDQDPPRSPLRDHR